MRKVFVLVTIWFILAQLTLNLVIWDGSPSLLVAFVAWVGGVMTVKMYDALKEAREIHRP